MYQHFKYWSISQCSNDFLLMTAAYISFSVIKILFQSRSQTFIFIYLFFLAGEEGLGGGGVGAGVKLVKFWDFLWLCVDNFVSGWIWPFFWLGIGGGEGGGGKGSDDLPDCLHPSPSGHWLVFGTIWSERKWWSEEMCNLFTLQNISMTRVVDENTGIVLKPPHIAYTWQWNSLNTLDIIYISFDTCSTTMITSSRYPCI